MAVTDALFGGDSVKTIVCFISADVMAEENQSIFVLDNRLWQGVLSLRLWGGTSSRQAIVCGA